MRKIWKVIIVVCCALLLLCLWNVGRMRQDIATLNNNINGNIRGLDASISSIYSRVQEAMETEASLLADFDWSYGDLNMQDYSIELSCSFLPKTYSPQQTTATLLINGQSHAMQLQDSGYCLRVQIPLFACTEVQAVRFSEGGQLRVQNLDWQLEPCTDLAPSISAYLSGSRGGQPYQIKGDLHIDIICRNEREDLANAVQSIALLQVQDGRIISRQPLSAEWVDESYGYVYLDINEKYEIPPGSTQQLIVEVEDSYGLFYRTVVDSCQLDEAGRPLETDMEEEQSVSVYDAAGQLLYENLY